jgi:hypothetical protein
MGAWSAPRLGIRSAHFQQDPATVERADIDEPDARNRIGKRASLGRRDELLVVVQSRRLADTSGQRALARLSLTSPVG